MMGTLPLIDKETGVMSWLRRLRVDPFLLVLILVVLLASLLPCRGEAKTLFGHLTTAAIALLFLCMVPSCRVRRSAPASATGGCIS